MNSKGSPAFTFRGDKAEILREARAVLRVWGYALNQKNEDGSALKADNEDEVIDIFTDTQFSSSKLSGGMEMGMCLPEKGWVTVIFWGRDSIR